MLLFGHTGITLGAWVLLNGAVTKSNSLRIRQHRTVEGLGPLTKTFSDQNRDSYGGASWHTSLTSLGNCIDIRLLLVGSLLPDIIDKPIGRFFFQDTISNGRIIGHTIFFLILITLAGIYLYKSRVKTSLLVVSFGTFTHLIFDQMWNAPRTLFWPIYGFTFDRGDITDWIPNILKALLTNPEVYVPEILGAIILGWFALALVRKRKAFYFLKYGQVQ